MYEKDLFAVVPAGPLGGLFRSSPYPAIQSCRRRARGRAVAMTTRYAASKGYVSYRFQQDATRRINLIVTGNANDCGLRILLPAGASASRFEIDGAPVSFQSEKIEQSTYAVVRCSLRKPIHVSVFTTPKAE